MNEIKEKIEKIETIMLKKERLEKTEHFCRSNSFYSIVHMYYTELDDEITEIQDLCEGIYPITSWKLDISDYQEKVTAKMLEAVYNFSGNDNMSFPTEGLLEVLAIVICLKQIDAERLEYITSNISAETLNLLVKIDKLRDALNFEDLED